MVIACTDAEMGFLTATRESEVVVLSPAHFLHFLQPVGVVVIHFIFRERGVVVQLLDVTGSITQLGVEIFLLQQHRILVAIEHLVAIGLVCACETEAVVDARITTHTALGLDLDDTIRALRAPDGCSGGVLQHGNALDVFRVHVQQLSEFLFVGILEVKVVGVGLPDVAVNDDEGL